MLKISTWFFGKNITLILMKLTELVNLFPGFPESIWNSIAWKPSSDIRSGHDNVMLERLLDYILYNLIRNAEVGLRIFDVKAVLQADFRIQLKSLTNSPHVL
jgi:hypothetical protein